MFHQIHQDTPAPTFHFAGLNEDMVIVLGKYRVHSHLYDAIKHRVKEIHPHLIRDASYTPEELLGASYWAELSDVGQRLATHCLEDLARQGVAQLGVMPCGDLAFYLD